MTAIIETQNIPSLIGHRRITTGLILALLFLRFFLVTGYRLLLGGEPVWVITIFEIGTYLLVAILLIWERRSLQDYHINPLSIWFIILFKPIETIYLSGWTWIHSPLAFPKLPSLVIWITALVLLIHFRALLFQKGAIQRRDIQWVLLGSLFGLALVLTVAYPISLQISQQPAGKIIPALPLLMSAAADIPYQIGYAAVSEEPVFRGFLWGWLRIIGWKDVWIWLFQAGLFVLAHLYYLSTSPISFWFVVPVGALVMGWLAWRSRSIAASMAAHGVGNGLSYATATVLAALRL